MDFHIFNVLILVILIAAYLFVRGLFQKIANFTEALGNSNNSVLEKKEEITKLNDKITLLEQQINKQS